VLALTLADDITALVAIVFGGLLLVTVMRIWLRREPSGSTRRWRAGVFVERDSADDRDEDES
jgi:hypothetical protein